MGNTASSKQGLVIRLKDSESPVLGEGQSNSRPNSTKTTRRVTHHTRLALTVGERQLLKQTWESLGVLKLQTVVETFVQIFNTGPDIKKSFPVEQTLTTEELRRDPILRLHGAKFRSFMDQQMKLICPEGGEPTDDLTAIELMRMTGLKHGHIKASPLDQEHFKVFTDTILRNMNERIKLTAKYKEDSLRKVWSTFLQIVITEMRDALYQKSRHKRITRMSFNHST